MKNKGVSLLAKGVATCPGQASAYGKCIAVNYKDAHKDMCVKEFQAFKQCVEKVDTNLLVRACVDDLVVDYYTFVEYTWSSLVSSTSRPICPVNMSTDQKPAAAPSATKQVSAQEETVTIVTTTAAASSTTATAITTTTEQVTAPITSVKSDVVVKEGETVEDDSHKVFVGNLSFQTKEEGLVEFFETSGKVLEAKIITIRPHYRRRSAGYGFVTFATLEDALKAAKDLNKKELDGREINVEVARPKPAVVKPAVNSESEGEPAPKQAKRRTRKNKNKKSNQVADETAQENNGVTTRETTAVINGQKDKDATSGGEETQTSQSDNASVASDASSSRAPRRSRRKNKNKAKDPEAAAAIAERRRVKKELTEPSQTTLFVANIPYSSTDETLQEVFKNYKVASAHVARMRNGRSKGYGFVDMESHDEQVKALENIKDVELEGRTIYLKVALSENPRENEEKPVESTDAPAKKEETKKETAPVDSAVIKKEPVAPVKKEEPAPAKKEEPVPAKKEEPVPAKKEEPVPAKKEEPVPAKKEESVPAKKEEPVPAKKEEPVAKKQ